MPVKQTGHGFWWSNSPSVQGVPAKQKQNVKKTQVEQRVGGPSITGLCIIIQSWVGDYRKFSKMDENDRMNRLVDQHEAI